MDYSGRFIKVIEFFVIVAVIVFLCQLRFILFPDRNHAVYDLLLHFDRVGDIV